VSVIDFRSPNSKRKSIRNEIKVAIGIFALVGTATVGTTLASNISLNSGGNVEFGQGVAQTTACDSNVILTPTSTFVNSEGGGDFLFTSVSVSDISESCFGKVFTLKAYKNGQSEPLDLYSTYNNADPSNPIVYSQIQITDTSGTFALKNAGLLSDDITSTGSDNFTVTFVTIGPPPSEAIASARDVDRITIESADVQNSELVVSTSGMTQFPFILTSCLEADGITGASPSPNYPETYPICNINMRDETFGYLNVATFDFYLSFLTSEPPVGPNAGFGFEGASCEVESQYISDFNGQPRSHMHFVCAVTSTYASVTATKSGPYVGAHPYTGPFPSL
jgi:hypothetical protein